ncbi:MAG TPA: hypothetical protein VMT03_11455 [Polyangia bacterium]|nr:hypothetical protein [Polyangia bacterium]
MNFKLVTAFPAAALALAAALATPRAARAEIPAQAPAATLGLNQTAAPAKTRRHLGAFLDVDAGLMIAMKQSAGLQGGLVYGPFRAGLSYSTFLSNKAFGGVPEGFSMRVNYIIGFNAAYFIGRHTDDGLYVQAMFHIKQQGVTNDATGNHKDLDSLAAGLELGYLWKVWKGLYVAPRVGALYYLESPQGPNNDPVQIGDRAYDNSRHKVWDTYFIPTLSLGYSW